MSNSKKPIKPNKGPRERIVMFCNRDVIRAKPPTQSDVAKACGLSNATAKTCLNEMVGRGAIKSSLGANGAKCFTIIDEAMALSVARSIDMLKSRSALPGKLVPPSVFEAPKTVPPESKPAETYLLAIRNPNTNAIEMSAFTDVDKALAVWSAAYAGGLAPTLYSAIELKPKLKGVL